METAAQPERASKSILWTGWVLSAIPVLMLLFSASMKLAKTQDVIQGFAHDGLAESLIIKIGILELCCALIYAVPKTAVLGAILLTAYLGGATITNLRVGVTLVAPILLGVLAWAGLLLRDQRLRPLLPLRSSQSEK